MLAPYRRVLAIPGALAFTTTGFIARLPISMATLGIVLLVVGETGSYGQAGAISAAFIIGEGVAAPLLARVIDRLGQGKVVSIASVVYGTGLAAMIVAVQAGAPTPVPHVLAVLAGGSYPPIGSCVRARWAHAIKDSGQLHTAYSFEAVVDESIFMVGPILVTVLATQIDPVAGVAAIVGFAVVGGLAFASLRSTEPPTTVRSSSREPIGWHFLLIIVLVSAALGSLFGATEVVTVAFAKEEGHGALVGGLLALWASGSLISGLITGLVAVRATPRVRFRWGTLGLALAMSPLPFQPNLWALGVNLFVGGFAISPTLVATVSLIETEVPAARLTEGMTWLSTGIAVGLAPGAAIAGRVIDTHGASTAYWVSVVSGLIAAGIAWTTGWRSGIGSGMAEPAAR
jgi:MFS family permease